MNKNSKSMRLMAAGMVAVITAGLAGTCDYQRNMITAKAAEIDTKELQEAAENALNTDSEETGKAEEQAAKEGSGEGEEQTAGGRAGSEKGRVRLCESGFCRKC